MKNTLQNFNALRPKQIINMPILTFSLSNKQDLRGIITDYVLHNIEQQGKPIPSRRFKSKYVKYPSITLKVNINKEEKEISFEFVNFLSKYIQFEKKNIYRQDRIQPLVVDILNFLDELDEKTKGITFQIENSNNQKKMEEQVMNLIIEKHHKDKQKRCYTFQIDEYKKKVIAKHTRVSYIDIQDQLKKKQKQFLLEISEVDGFDFKKDSKHARTVIIPAGTSSTLDKLDALIQSGQIFQNPDKIKLLKKQKMLQFYQSNQVEYLNYKTLITDDFGQLDDNCFSNSCIDLLKNWIVDISIAERYYQMKFGKIEKKKISNVKLNLISELDQKLFQETQT